MQRKTLTTHMRILGSALALAMLVVVTTPELPRAATPFIKEDVATSATTMLGLYAAVALDNNSQVGVLFSNGASGHLEFAHKTGSAWDVETVSTDGSGSYCSLVFDGNGVAH